MQGTPPQPQRQPNDKSAVVIGAGMIGVCSAWHLQRRGFKVTVVDRKDPGEETSWGNGGLIQRECVLPYGFPNNGLLHLLSIALNQRTDVRYSLHGLLREWKSLAWYWYYSRPTRYEKIAREFETLISHCVDEHSDMIAAACAEKLVRRVGFVEFYRTEPFQHVRDIAEDYRSRGVLVDVLTADELGAMEPNLDCRCVSGAMHFTQPLQCVDPGALVKAYADQFVRSGGTTIRTTVQGIQVPVKGGTKYSVVTETGTLEAETVVVATGPWSADLVRPLGYSLPLTPLRGYSAHFKFDEKAKLNHSVVDIENGFVMGPMQQGIRITTGGEVTTLDAPPNEVQLRKSETLARELLPIGDQVGAVWYGHRPCMPDMKPVIGEAPRHPGLWFNFGHGHSGFTLGPVSGRLLAELIANETPVINPAPFSPTRFL